MKSLKDMTLEDLTAANKDLMRQKAAITAQQAEISDEVRHRVAEIKATAFVANLRPHERALYQSALANAKTSPPNAKKE